MVAARTPTLAEIKNSLSLADARALLTIAVCEVCDFFNVGKNMSDTQIALTVDLILEHFWHLHLEEIKYCFRRAMLREKLYDRLDGNIILGWLSQYDDQRTEEAIRLSENEDTRAQAVAPPSPEAIPLAAYLSRLRDKSAFSPEAARQLREAESILSSRLMSHQETEKTDRDFKIWKMSHYLSRREQ